MLLLVVGCLTSQPHASISQERVCTGSSKCCHTETGVTDQTCYLIQSQYADNCPTILCTDPMTPAARGRNHWSTNFFFFFFFLVTDMTGPVKSPRANAGMKPWACRSWGGRLSAKPTRQSTARENKILLGEVVCFHLWIHEEEEEEEEEGVVVVSEWSRRSAQITGVMRRVVVVVVVGGGGGGEGGEGRVSY